jgi:hypothetical protein
MGFFEGFFNTPQAEIPKGRLDPEGGDDFGPKDYDEVTVPAEEQRINMRLMVLAEKLKNDPEGFTDADGDEMTFLQNKLENLQVSKKYIN